MTYHNPTFDINSLSISNKIPKKQQNNKQNKYTQNKHIQNKYKQNKYMQNNNIYYMDIDVEKGMCQGIYYKNNIAMKCNNKAKYLQNNMFELCECHKNQKIAC